MPSNQFLNQTRLIIEGILRGNFPRIMYGVNTQNAFEDNILKIINITHVQAKWK